jgi:hypothetical protein
VYALSRVRAAELALPFACGSPSWTLGRTKAIAIARNIPTATSIPTGTQLRFEADAGEAIVSAQKCDSIHCSIESFPEMWTSAETCRKSERNWNALTLSDSNLFPRVARQKQGDASVSQDNARALGVYAKEKEQKPMGSLNPALSLTVCAHRVREEELEPRKE